MASAVDSKRMRSLHIVAFPWLAFGHMLPYLQLSISLAKRGHHISYISTPRNIQRLLPKLPPNLSHLINFVALPLPETEGLPSDAEATSDLKTAFDSLHKPFSEFIHQSSPIDWILRASKTTTDALIDFAQYWAGSVSVPIIYFNIIPATSLAFIGCSEEHVQSRTTPEQLTIPPPWFPFPSNVALRLHEARRLFNDSYITNTSGVTDIYRLMSVIKACTALAIRSCHEFEADCISLLSELTKKPAIPVGLLPPPIVTDTDHEIEDLEGKKIIEWLDEQKPGSVLYIAFGSETELTNMQMNTLALGLELSALPFLWVIRKMTVEMFPGGFDGKSKTKGHGLMVVNGWVQQMKILSHESVGGFMTHSGWSSVIESLQFGHPLILLPIAVDQGIIARIMVENGVGIEVERDDKDGSFSEEAVAKLVRKVMVGEEGKGLRKRASEMGGLLVRDEEMHEKYVDGLVEFMMSNTEVEG